MDEPAQRELTSPSNHRITRITKIVQSTSHLLNGKISGQNISYFESLGGQRVG